MDRHPANAGVQKHVVLACTFCHRVETDDGYCDEPWCVVLPGWNRQVQPGTCSKESLRIKRAGVLEVVL